MSKATFFIGDVHLNESNSAIYSAFCQFLHDIQHKAEALYIIGDLFDYWVTNQQISLFHKEVATVIRHFAIKVPVYFCHGNRDFLLNYQYARLAHIHLLPEISIINLYHKRCLIAHGDQFCTDDIAYQRLRELRNNHYIRQCFSLLPEKCKYLIAKKLRNHSKKNNTKKSTILMDVNNDYINTLFKNYQLNYIIHGHTHKANIHDLGHQKKRIDVGDWYHHISYCQLDLQGIQLIKTEL